MSEGVQTRARAQQDVVQNRPDLQAMDLQGGTEMNQPGQSDETEFYRRDTTEARELIGQEPSHSSQSWSIGDRNNCNELAPDPSRIPFNAAVERNAVQDDTNWKGHSKQ